MTNNTKKDIVEKLNSEEEAALREMWQKHEDPDAEDFISEDEFWEALEKNKKQGE